MWPEKHSVSLSLIPPKEIFWGLYFSCLTNTDLYTFVVSALTNGQLFFPTYSAWKTNFSSRCECLMQRTHCRGDTTTRESYKWSYHWGYCLCFSAGLQKKDVHMLRFIQEVNTTTRSCALWDLDEDTEYIVHVQSISMGGSSPPSEPVLFRTPKESEKMASKSPGEGQ